MLQRYGIDLGGVIIGGPGNDTQFFTKDYLATPAVNASFEGVRKLVSLVGPENAFLVSKARTNTRRKSLEWLRQPFREDFAGMDFFQYTGVIDSDDHVHFCDERRDKAPIAKELGITDFIDDKAEVLTYMEGIVPNRILFGPQKNPTPPGIIHLPSWREISFLT